MVSRSSTRFSNICIASICKARHLKRAEIVIIDGTILGVSPDVVTYDTLINAYSRFVSFEAAYSVLDRMKEACINPDVFTCNSLIAGAMRHCLLSKCMDLFEEMLEWRIKDDVWSYNTLMRCFFKLGKPDEMNRVFTILYFVVYLLLQLRLILCLRGFARMVLSRMHSCCLGI